MWLHNMTCTIAGATIFSTFTNIFLACIFFYLVNENIYFPLATDSQTVYGQMNR